MARDIPGPNLAGRTGPVSAHPVAAHPVALDTKVTAGVAFTTIAHACLEHFAGNRAAVAAGDAEGVHQMRVGLRRMAAAMSFFKKLLGDGESRRVKRELKWLLGELGPVRDIDVLIDETVAPLQRQRIDGRALTALKGELRTRRRTRLARAKDAVASARYRLLVRDIGIWAAAGAWTDSRETSGSAHPFADAEFARRQKKLAKKLKKLATLDPLRRHKLRIAAKKLRYAEEFFADLYDGHHAHRRLKRHDKALKTLQSALGKLNDMRTHDTIVGDFLRARRHTAKKPQKAFALGLISGEDHAHVAGLLHAARKAGKHLRATAPFWN